MNNSNVDYYLKYLKYKNKYLSLKKGGSLLEDIDYKNLTVQENLLINQEMISNTSKDGIIYKVTYNDGNFVYKKAVLSRVHSPMEKFNLLGDNYLIELILELKILIKISDETDNILKVFKIVVDENNKFTGWLMEDLSHMITLTKFCKQEDLDLNESKDFITEQLSNAIITLNNNGFSLEKIEYSDNLMIDPTTKKIKLIDLDGILDDPFIADWSEKIIVKEIFEDSKICDDNLCKLTIEKYTEKFNNDKNLSPYYEDAMKLHSKNEKLLRAYSYDQRSEKVKTQEYHELK